MITKESIEELINSETLANAFRSEDIDMLNEIVNIANQQGNYPIKNAITNMIQAFIDSGGLIEQLQAGNINFLKPIESFTNQGGNNAIRNAVAVAIADNIASIDPEKIEELFTYLINSCYHTNAELFIRTDSLLGSLLTALVNNFDREIVTQRFDSVREGLEYFALYYQPHEYVRQLYTQMANIAYEKAIENNDFRYIRSLPSSIFIKAYFPLIQDNNQIICNNLKTQLNFLPPECFTNFFGYIFDTEDTDYQNLKDALEAETNHQFKAPIIKNLKRPQHTAGKQIVTWCINAATREQPDFSLRVLNYLSPRKLEFVVYEHGTVLDKFLNYVDANLLYCEQIYNSEKLERCVKSFDIIYQLMLTAIENAVIAIQQSARSNNRHRQIQIDVLNKIIDAKDSYHYESDRHFLSEILQDCGNLSSQISNSFNGKSIGIGSWRTSGATTPAKLNTVIEDYRPYIERLEALKDKINHHPYITHIEREEKSLSSMSI